jgi:hypothetical protein
MVDTTTARSLTEAHIQKGLTDLLHTLGFETFHNRYAIGSDPGFPDIVAVRDDGAMVVVECKGPKGRIRPGQHEWLRRFRAVPGCIFCEIVGPRRAMWYEGYDDALALIERAAREYRT